MSRGGMKSQTVENSVVGLGGNQFETGVVSVPANSTLKKGAVLKRNGAKFEVVSLMSAETPVVVNPFDIENSGSAAADMSLRAIISGPVRADLLLVGDQKTTDVQNDMIRSYGIIPIKVNDISRTN